MKTLSLSGTLQSVSFFEDDTIETVRQWTALAMGSHPDRLFIEVKATLPKDYYATNPVHWTNLFLRLSMDGQTISSDRLKIYLTQIRMATGVSERDVTRDEWESHEDFLRPLYDPSSEFDEWRLLGVDDVHSFVMPLPPTELPGLQAASRPLLQTQSLFETHHPYEVSELRATVLPDGASANVKLNYYPRLKSDTPPTIESVRASLEGSQRLLKTLMDLDTPKNQTVSVVRAKWYVPLVSTRFTSPRARFEQIFYGLTVSPETPYIGYFTAKTDTTRHKFYVENPKDKKPFVDTSMWKGWTSNTQPQRKLPTLLFYRGSSRTSFDRVAVTDRDITIDVRRDRGSTETLEELKLKAMEWIKTLDGLTPFLMMSDLELARWDLSDLSVLATYAKEVREFDMHRFPCLQSIFGFQNDTFRLLRAEHTSDDISPRELQALQVLNQDDAVQTPEYLAEQLNLPVEEARELLSTVIARTEELNLEKSLRAYPVLKFSNKEVIIKFVTNLDRTLQYANLLRHVLTSDAESVDQVCPRRMEKVVPKVAIPQQELQMESEFTTDEDFNALLGFDAEEEPAEEATQSVQAPKEKKVKVAAKTMGTYNYFNRRLQEFDPATFDKSVYPGKCDKPKQVIVLTPDDEARIGPEYNFSNVPDSEKHQLNDPDGKVICPPYWCMRDEIPLREDQLKLGDDGMLHCPVCDGKVRTSDTLDTLEFTIIKRDGSAKFPDDLRISSTLNGRKMPCCFQTPRATNVLGAKDEPTYVLDATTTNLPGMRFAYLPETMAQQLSLETEYATSVKKGRLTSGESDLFRVGLGRPSKTLPQLLNDMTPILRPSESRENLMRCSFFRTWKQRGRGDTYLDQIVSSIDYAYQHGELGFLEELEYVTTFLKCEVIRINMETSRVECGFWSETSGASSRTLLLIGNGILAQVSRVRDKKGFKTEFTTDLRKPIFKSVLPIVRGLHVRACAIENPTLNDAVQELLSKGKTSYEVILDPFKRIQAVLVPKEIILPIQPSTLPPEQGIPVREGFHSLSAEDLPVGSAARAFLSTTKHAKFKVQSELHDVTGRIVELELTSGLRVPIQPEETEDTEEPKEVLETMRRIPESQLVEGMPNAADLRLAQEISYSTEVYEFLLYSLSKDIELEEYGTLKDAIVQKRPSLYKELTKWFKAEAYEDTTKAPIEFLNKVRTPCGQFTDKNKCSKSSLCGWHKNTCKIRVKPIVEKEAVLKRIATTLRDNDKQRALVLDGRLSPFFSTILYLEMPHEWITTVV
jgi:hypothetical protein